MRPKETVTVPADIVVDLRTGLYAQIGIAGEQLDRLTAKPDRERHPEWYRKPLDDLDRVRSLLDAIGWRQSDTLVASVELDLSEHQWALLRALETMLEAIEDPDTNDMGDAARSTPPAVEAARRRASAIRAFVHSITTQDQYE